jgi:hypothetical protein
MPRLITVTCCGDCPHLWWSGSYRQCTARNPRASGPEGPGEIDLTRIPEWCPLPDAQEPGVPANLPHNAGQACWVDAINYLLDQARKADT